MSNPLIYVDLQYTPKPDGFDGHRWQPWSIMVCSGDNHEALFRSTERYTNRADAVHAAQIAFGAQSNVYLREHEKGNVELRLASDHPSEQS